MSATTWITNWQGWAITTKPHPKGNGWWLAYANKPGNDLLCQASSTQSQVIQNIMRCIDAVEAGYEQP